MLKATARLKKDSEKEAVVEIWTDEILWEYKGHNCNKTMVEKGIVKATI
ncbi:MAG: hypothetical protein AB7F28_03720 [Candidatus Margulisiibacteriota bacterium]